MGLGPEGTDAPLMETLLGSADASRPLQYWGYLDSSGKIAVKRYGGMEAIKETVATDGVVHVRGPFIAFGSGAAMAVLRDKIATAKVVAARKRLEAMPPSCPIQHEYSESNQ
jgi:hypothetical protein